MESYYCQPAAGPIDATVRLPGSKSITNRGLIAAALADGHNLLSNMLLAEDTQLMLDALRALGIAITVDQGECVVEVTGCRGHIPALEAELFCGNAGTVMRFCTALAATGYGRFRLDGVERMRARPMGPLLAVLQALGTGIEYLGNEGYAPFIVHAKGLRGGHVSFDSPESSQFVSALLLAAPYAGGDVLIEVAGNTPSIPYLKMTTLLMERFGVAVIEHYEETGARFVVEAPQRYTGANLAVEPDASNASYFLAAPAIAGGRVTVERLGTNSIQGDVGFADVLGRMGCRVERTPDRLTVFGPVPGERLHGVDVDLSDMPDVAQTLAVLALFAAGPTTIRNVPNLRLKETDRLAALSSELTKLGAHVEEWPDGLRVDPPRQMTPATIDTYDDHRMAMSFALAGLGAKGVVINDPQCCRKSFPDFFQRFEQLRSSQRS